MLKHSSYILFFLLLCCQSFEEDLGLYKQDVNALTIATSDKIIGGGVGYSGIVNSAGATIIIGTFDSLRNAINSAQSGAVIYIRDNSTIDFGTDSIMINVPMTIASGRGKTAATGATLTYTTTNRRTRFLFYVQAHNVRITGIKFDGKKPQIDSHDDSKPELGAISINGFHSLIVDNCELTGWTAAGIMFLNSANGKATNNYMHHNRYDGYGYGIEVAGVDTYVRAHYNLFHHNRHDIAGSGHHTSGYEASYNLIQTGGQSFSFDMHGESKSNPTQICGSPYAGDSVYIHHNTFLNDTITETIAVPAIGIRGRPMNFGRIENNTFIHYSHESAIVQPCETLCDQGICSTGCDGPGCSTTCQPAPTPCDSGLVVVNNKFLKSASFVNKEDILILNTNGDLIKYVSDNRQFFGAEGTIVGNGFLNYSQLFKGTWEGNMTGDLIALTTTGEFHLYPYDGSFYDNNGGTLIGNGFSYENYFVGKWNAGNTSDLIARTSSGDLHYYPFTGQDFYTENAGATVGHGFSYQQYFIGNWTGDGTSDLITRDANGDLFLYPFRNGTFYNNNGGQEVGWNFNYQEYFASDWNGDNISDLLCLSANGELHLYTFNSNSVSFNSYSTVGTGFTYAKYLVGDFIGDAKPDLITMDTDGNFWLYPFISNTFVGPAYAIGAEYAAEKYFVGQWGSN